MAVRKTKFSAMYRSTTSKEICKIPISYAIFLNIVLFHHYSILSYLKFISNYAKDPQKRECFTSHYILYSSCMCLRHGPLQRKHATIISSFALHKRSDFSSLFSLLPEFEFISIHCIMLDQMCSGLLLLTFLPPGLLLFCTSQRNQRLQLV